MQRKVYKMDKIKEKSDVVPRFSGKKKVVLIVVAVLLLAAVLLGVILSAANASPTVLKYGSSSLKENVYAYWLACFKYDLMATYKGMLESDSAAAWAKLMENGQSYDDWFKEAAHQQIALRFVASVLFDRTGAKLPEGYYSAIEKALSDMEEYDYDEDAFGILKEKYGVSARELKRIALYEAKYAGLKAHMFGSDGSGVYGAAYAERLASFYKENYLLFNVIYLSDEKSGAAKAELETLLEDGLTEEEFEAFEKEHSEMKVTEKYPDGIYIYRAGNYSSAFSAELLNAMAAADAVGKIAARRDGNDKGTYYVMRYALPEAPYLTNDEKVRFSLQGFEEYAASYLYYEELNACLAQAVWVSEITSGYSMAKTIKAQDYNIRKFLEF